MLNVVMLNVVMLNVNMLIVVTLNVVAQSILLVPNFLNEFKTDEKMLFKKL